MRLFYAFSATTILLSSACTPSLGECDDNAARTPVFFRGADGNPRNGEAMYPGQALMQLHCGDATFCHAGGITASSRIGAPAEMDFNVALACAADDESCDPTAAERLVREQGFAFDHRHNILRTLDNGSMPPGEAGDGSRGPGDYYYEPDPSITDEPLPEIRTDEARDIIRNWLACGAPVVERNQRPVAGERLGGTCSGVAETELEVGACVLGGGGIAPPDPNWNSIFTTIIGPLCVTCHNQSSPQWTNGDTELDLCPTDESGRGCEAEATRLAIVGEAAPNCGGSVVTAGNAAESLLIQKMRGTGSCVVEGSDFMTIMPPMNPLSDEVIAPIEAWIQDGAN